MFNTAQPSHESFRAIVAERTTPIVAWVGAGVSKTAGLPGWRELQDRLCDALRRKAAELEDSAKAKANERFRICFREPNPWVAFSILKDALGQTSFKAHIREALGTAGSVPVPRAYKCLWQLRPRGIITLNLDRLATRAHSAEHPGTALNEFSGGAVAKSSHLLKSPHSFVANLHGIEADESTWVLTADELRALHTAPGFREFISAVFTTMTVLFIGITADDMAAGGLLAQLTDRGVDTGQHFWITHRRDSVADQWSERAGLRVIRYNSDDGHSELDEFFDDIQRFVPIDPPAPPIKPAVPVEGEPLPSLADLLKVPAEDEIRTHLNRHAAKLLAPSNDVAYSAFERFCEEYDPAIYRAWYVTTKPPRNSLLGYTLKKEIARGAFGQVYEADAKDGSTVAIKVLHEEVRRDRDMLQCFRRGARSMAILSTRGVKGMVPYLAASEIPAFVVMSLVDGPNLQHVVRTREIDTWAEILKIAADLTSIIRAAHGVPERVLHRDIKPANIMLRNFYGLAGEWEVVVLDFDLSWHREAIEVSIISASSASGYLAPEQLRRDLKVSTRNAAVDSFGLGMTLYHLCTGREPMVGDHARADWISNVRASVAHRACSSWRSLPTRMARLICASTRDAQHERWDISQILGELERLRTAEASPASVRAAELLAEECFARTAFADRAEWHPDRLASSARLASGVEVTCRGDESMALVETSISWIDKGTAERRKIGKWIGKAFDQAEASLRRGGWKTEARKVEAQSGRLVTRRSVAEMGAELDRAAAAIDEACKALEFR